MQWFYRAVLAEHCTEAISELLQCIGNTSVISDISTVSLNHLWLNYAFLANVSEQ